MKAQQSTTEITLVDEAHWIARYFTYEGIDYFMPFLKEEQEWELLAVIDEEYLPEVEGAAAVAAWLTQRGIRYLHSSFVMSGTHSTFRAKRASEGDPPHCLKQQGRMVRRRRQRA